MVEMEEEFDIDPEFQQHDIKSTNASDDVDQAIVRLNN